MVFWRMASSRPPVPGFSDRLIEGESPTLPMAPRGVTLGVSPKREAVEIPRLELTVEHENGVVCRRLVAHDGDIARIGSHPSNHVVISDPLVSRFHCCAKLEQGGWRVVDTGSLNGTRVEGVKVRDADLPVPQCR